MSRFKLTDAQKQRAAVFAPARTGLNTGNKDTSPEVPAANAANYTGRITLTEDQKALAEKYRPQGNTNRAFQNFNQKYAGVTRDDWDSNVRSDYKKLRANGGNVNLGFDRAREISKYIDRNGINGTMDEKPLTRDEYDANVRSNYAARHQSGIPALAGTDRRVAELAARNLRQVAIDPQQQFDFRAAQDEALTKKVAGRYNPATNRQDLAQRDAYRAQAEKIRDRFLETDTAGHEAFQKNPSDISGNWNYLVELAGKDKLSDRDKTDARAALPYIMEQIRSSGGKPSNDVMYLYNRLSGMQNTGGSFTAGLAGRYSAIADKLSGALGMKDQYLASAAPENPRLAELYRSDSLGKTLGRAAAVSPVLAQAGAIVGDLSKLQAAGDIVGAIPAISGLKGIAASIVRPAATFGLNSAVDAASEANWSKPWQAIGKTAAETAIGAVGGAAGGAASYGIGQGVASLLRQHGWFYEPWAKNLLQGLSSAGFVAASGTVGEAANYAKAGISGEAYRPQAKQILTNALVMGLYSYLTSAVENRQLSQDAATAINARMEQQEQMITSLSRNSQTEEGAARKCYEALYLNQQMKNDLSNTMYVGQGVLVDKAKESIDKIDELIFSSLEGLSPEAKSSALALFNEAHGLSWDASFWVGNIGTGSAEESAPASYEAPRQLAEGNGAAENRANPVVPEVPPVRSVAAPVVEIPSRVGTAQNAGTQAPRAVSNNIGKPETERPSAAVSGPTSVTRSASGLASVAKTLGTSGQKAIFNQYDGNADTGEYAAGFVSVYNAGRGAGKSAASAASVQTDGQGRITDSRVPAAKGLTEPQRLGAFLAGQNDAEGKASDGAKTALPNEENRTTISVRKVREDKKAIRGNGSGRTETGNPNSQNVNTTSPHTDLASDTTSVTQGAEQVNGDKSGENGRTAQLSASGKLADKISGMVKSGRLFNSAWLFEQADKAFGGTQAQGVYTPKDAYDAMELAVNKSLLESSKVTTLANENAASAKSMVSKLENMLKLLPTQTKRTEEMEQFQQFSTPPNIAYLAAWSAGIRPTDTVLEPSAGIGGLALWPKAWGAKVYANELSERRLALLNQLGLDGTFNLNAEQIDNLLPDNVKPSVVLMNPPFSSTAGRTAVNKTANAERHIEQALERLEPNGRLVAILGRGMADDAPVFRKWWDNLKSEYNVRANLRIDGKNYKKYGTTFDIQLVVIDKNGPTEKTVTGSCDDLSKVPDLMEGIRNDRIAVQENAADGVERSGERTDLPGRGRADARDSVRAAGRPESEGLGTSVQSGSAGDGRKLPGEHRSGVRGAAGAVSDGRGTGGAPDKLPRAVPAEHGHGKLPGESDAGRAALSRPVKSEVSLSEKKSEAAAVEADPDNVYSRYEPRKTRIEGAKKHPAKLVESAAMSAVDPPDVTYTPNLPKSLITSGALSDAQLENIIYAGQAHAQKLPDGTRKGYFIGDGTGVGKGRQISGILMDNFRQGRTKAVWITNSWNLLEDAQRDWSDLGGKKTDIFPAAKYKVGTDIPAENGILFSTYTTLPGTQGKNGADTRLTQIGRWLGKDFDGVIAFDEAHNMGNAIGQTGARGKTKPSQKALAGIKLQQMFPNARVVYASATGATSVSNYAYLERLGLWGRGTAFHDVNDFVSKISDGGLAAMELVARDMKAMGVYMARSISYDDVRYDTLQHDLTPVQTEIYNTMSRAWQKVFQNIGSALDLTNGSKNGQARSAAWSAFYTSQQRFYNQVLTSMSVPTLVEDIRKELADGRSCVIQLVNTNEAAANRAIAKSEDEGTDLDDLDMTPSESLIGFLENSFPVNAYEEYTDEKGNTQSRLVLDGDGNPVQDKKAVRQRDALIAELQQMKVPDGPMELLFDAFGTEEIAEVTGRSRRVVEKPDENGHLHRVVEKRGKESGLADAQMFQDGKKRILVFSDAGGTGKSYHADRRAKNQQQRIHYLLQPGWNAAKAVQGFGRTHRSNEASAPVYKLITTNIMGQKRFTSTIARRLDQLGALTKGQRQTGSGMFGEKDNLENPIAQDALERYYQSMPVESVRKLGLCDKLYDQYGVYKPDQNTARDIGRFLNRILSLEVDEQNAVFSGFYDTFERMMDAAISSGSVDMGLENYMADRIEVQDEKVIRTDESGADTKYVQLTAYRKPDLISFRELKGVRPDFCGMVRMEDGTARAVYEISPKTNIKGEIEKRYRLQAADRNQYSVYVQSTLDEKTETIEKKDWESAWKQELAKAPEFDETKLHLLTGTLLPIWDKLPASNTRVMRVLTTDGKQYLGRLIRSTDIDGVLRGLGAARTKEVYTAPQISEKVLRDGKTAVLRDNRIKLVRRRVSGEARMEICGNNVWYLSRQYPGIISEKIGYVFRYFIPTGEAGEKILSALMKDNPVVDVQDAREDVGVDQLKAAPQEKNWTAQRAGNAEKAPMALSEIVNKIRHDFEIPVTTGHIRKADTLGTYDRDAQGIRSRIANDLPTISHELGHHLDNLYHMTSTLDKKQREELVSNLPNTMRVAYKQNKWATEGFAEYIRRFLQNRETAAIDYPEFTKLFLGSLKARDSVLLEQLADEVNAYYSLDAETGVSAVRLAEEKGRDFRTTDEKLREKGDAYYQAWIDSNRGIRVFDRAANSGTYKIASNAAYADAVAGAVLTGDLTDANGQYVAPGLSTALSGVNLKDRTEYRAFGEYLIARHGPERLKEGMRVYADDRKNSTAFMERRQAELEAQYPEFKEAAERLYQFESDFLKTWGVRTGLVSEESAKSWAERWKFYVPFNRAVGDKGLRGARRGYANQGSTIRKAIGSGLDIVHPVDNIVRNVVRMVNAGIRNNVMAEITTAAERKGGMADFLEKVPMPMKRAGFRTTDLKDMLGQAVEESSLTGSDADAAFEIVNGIDDILYQYGRGKAHGDVVTVLKNGDTEYWKINDPMLLESITGLDAKKLPAWLETYAATSRFVTANLTGNNVLWSIFSNAPRDLMTFWTFSKDKNLLHLVGGITSSYANKLRGSNADPLYKEYLAMGGGKTSVYTADRDLTKNIRRKLAGDKRTWLNPMEWLAFVSDTIETGPRYSYYKLCREKYGMTPQEAFYESTDITVNFRRGGVQSRTINKVIPFFNAGVQGIDKFARWVSADDAPAGQRGKAVRGRVLAFLSASAALAGLIYGLNSKSEEDKKNYAQLSNYTKNTYWCIPMGDGKFFTIPKPREIAVLSSFMEACAEYYGNRNEHAFDEFYSYTADTMLPNVVSDLAQLDLGGAVGNLGFLGTIVRIFANRDFLGKPIVSSGLQSLEPKDQYTSRTSELAKIIGQAFNVSPQMVDYFGNNVLGGWWKAQKSLFPVGGENVDYTLGIQGNYIRDSQYSTDLLNRIYDAADKSARHAKSNPDDIDAKIQSKRDSSMTEFYSAYNKLSKDKQETTARRASRQTVLDMVNEYLKDADTGYKTDMEKAVEKVCSDTGSTEYLPSVMSSSVKDANEEVHLLTDSQYVEYQTNYLKAYWEYIEDTYNTSDDSTKQQAVLKAAKDTAKESATRRVLGSIGAPVKATKYDGVPDTAVIQFKAGIDLANNDGSLKQDEVIAIIKKLQLNKTQSSTLFHSKYDSDKNNPW